MCRNGSGDTGGNETRGRGKKQQTEGGRVARGLKEGGYFIYAGNLCLSWEELCARVHMCIRCVQKREERKGGEERTREQTGRPPVSPCHGGHCLDKRSIAQQPEVTAEATGSEQELSLPRLRRRDAIPPRGAQQASLVRPRRRLP